MLARVFAILLLLGTVTTLHAVEPKLSELQLEQVKTQRLEEAIVALQLENAQLAQALAQTRQQLVQLAAQTTGAAKRKALTDTLIKALDGNPEKDTLDWSSDVPTLVKGK